MTPQPMDPETRAKQTVGACTHASQWTDTSLVACEACVARAIREAVDAEREACAAMVDGMVLDFGQREVTTADGVPLAAAIRARR